MQDTTAARLEATYFDGQSAQPHAVALQMVGDQLHIDGTGISRTVPWQQVQWPERTRHGKRIAHFISGGLVQCDDAQAWDAWRSMHGQRDGLVVRMQQNWRAVALSGAMLVCLVGAVYVWGLPWMAQTVVALTPRSVDTQLGVVALESIDESWMQPSALSAAQQQSIQQAWQQAVASLAPEQVPQWQLLFRKSKLGPNAFALPGGTMVVTDELVELVDADNAVITAVLAHELGHVQHRDGLRMVFQVAVLGGISSLVLGDFSSILAAAPVLLGQAQYSREAERQADVYAVAVLRQARISPAVMVTLFEKLAQARKTDQEAESQWGILFASHPADAERIAFFKAAAENP